VWVPHCCQSPGIFEEASADSQTRETKLRRISAPFPAEDRPRSSESQRDGSRRGRAAAPAPPEVTVSGLKQIVDV